MKTAQEIRERIHKTNESKDYYLSQQVQGQSDIAQTFRAAMILQCETEINALNWVLGEKEGE